jgi:hypothetical protein
LLHYKATFFHLSTVYIFVRTSVTMCRSHLRSTNYTTSFQGLSIHINYSELFHTRCLSTCSHIPNITIVVEFPLAFPRATAANYHKFYVSRRKKFILSPVWRTQVWNQSIDRTILPPKPLRECRTFFLLAIMASGITWWFWLLAATLNLFHQLRIISVSPVISPCVCVCVCVCKESSHLKLISINSTRCLYVKIPCTHVVYFEQVYPCKIFKSKTISSWDAELVNICEAFFSNQYVFIGTIVSAWTYVLEP